MYLLLKTYYLSFPGRSSHKNYLIYFIDRSSIRIHRNRTEYVHLEKKPPAGCSQASIHFASVSVTLQRTLYIINSKTIITR